MVSALFGAAVGAGVTYVMMRSPHDHDDQVIRHDDDQVTRDDFAPDGMCAELETVASPRVVRQVQNVARYQRRAVQNEYQVGPARGCQKDEPR